MSCVERLRPVTWILFTPSIFSAADMHIFHLLQRDQMRKDTIFETPIKAL